MKIQTKAVHAGDRKRPQSQIPVATPVHFAASWITGGQAEQDRIFAGEEKGYAYSRYANPTSDALEELITSLENGAGSLACASGMAALQHSITCALLNKPKKVLCARDIYGATLKLLFDVMAHLGVETRLLDTNDLNAVQKAVGEFQPGCLLMETISNPLLRIGDVPAVAEICRRAGVVLIVDNTFATPLLVRPLEHGADFVVHSSTKYLGGHGDTLGGLITTTDAFLEDTRRLSRINGPVLGPMEAFLTMRGIKTFPLRMERQCQNARALAAWLRTHPSIERVHYPDDPAHPDAEVIKRLLPCDSHKGGAGFSLSGGAGFGLSGGAGFGLSGGAGFSLPEGLYGGMVSLEIRGAAKQEIFAFLDRLRLIVKATSLGDVHTMALYPWISSHRDVPPAQKAEMGVRENLVRMSVGIEHIDDITADIAQALG